MNNKADIFIACILMAVLMEMLLPVMPSTKAYKYSQAITNCESELPRSQKCEAYARPIIRGDK